MRTIEDIIRDYLHQEETLQKKPINSEATEDSFSASASNLANGTIILAITSANADIATSGAIRVAQQYDPTGTNTIHVFTKLDILDRGVRADDLLAGRLFKGRPIGVVGVVNRAQEDLDESMDLERARRNEEKFLQKNYPKVASKHGIRNLENLLTSVLKDRLQIALPQIRNQLKEILQAYVKDLERFPSRNPEALIRFKDDALFKLYKSIQNKLLGESRLAELYGEQRTDMFGAKIFEYLHRNFREELMKPDPVELLTDQVIEETIKLSRGIREPMFLHNEAFEHLAQKAICLLKDPCFNCEQNIFEILSHGILSELDHLNLDNFRVLKQTFEDVLNRVLEKRHAKAKEQVELQLKIEQTNIVPNDAEIRKLAAKVLNETESPAEQDLALEVLSARVPVVNVGKSQLVSTPLGPYPLGSGGFTNPKVGVTIDNQMVINLLLSIASCYRQFVLLRTYHTVFNFHMCYKCVQCTWK